MGATSGSAHTDVELATLLRQLTVEVDRFAELFGQAHGIHRTDLDALAVIMDSAAAGRALSPGQLAAALHLSASTVTALLDRLEAAGHVRRGRSGADRRRVELHVHERALALGRAFFAPLNEEMSARWTEFSTPERQVIARFLQCTIDATVRVRAGLAVSEE